MKIRHFGAWLSCSLILGTLGAACSGTDNPGSSSAGGNPGVGGLAGSAGAIGGTVATGGASQAGGAANSSGGVNTGGAANTGGTTSTAGAASTGGTTATGGSAATGGNSSVGGTKATGGSLTAGGVSTTGGGSNVGGAKATGGGSAVGGATSVGGTKATGGAATTGGSKATGGTSAAGGTKATGGMAATGGTAGAGGKPYKGVANSPCLARTNLNVSWYYNWMQTANEPCSSPNVGGEFVPIIWGHTGAEQTAASITSAIAAMVGRGNTSVLGFNEPESTTQSNIPVATAISLWPAFNNPAIRVGTPATSAGPAGVTWFNSFTTQLNANVSLRGDFLAIHWYGWSLASCDATGAALEGYINQIQAIPGNRPIWLTEWGCLSLPAGTTDAVTRAHMAGAIAMFARHPRLERYAWYPWASAIHSLNNADGTLTALGAIYAAAPAYK